MDLEDDMLDQLRRRDPRGLEACYASFGRRVRRLCKGLLGNDADAEDAAQEVFLKLFERAPQFEGRARFSTWVHRLTVNHCLNRRQRERTRRAESLSEDNSVHREQCDQRPGPVLRAAQAELQGQLSELLQLLPEKQRTALVLRELEGLTYREIAVVLEIPDGTVMSRLARARESLLRLAGPALAADARAPNDPPRTSTMARSARRTPALATEVTP